MSGSLKITSQPSQHWMGILSQLVPPLSKAHRPAAWTVVCGIESQAANSMAQRRLRDSPLPSGPERSRKENEDTLEDALGGMESGFPPRK